MEEPQLRWIVNWDSGRFDVARDTQWPDAPRSPVRRSMGGAWFRSSGPAAGEHGGDHELQRVVDHDREQDHAEGWIALEDELSHGDAGGQRFLGAAELGGDAIFHVHLHRGADHADDAEDEV